MEPKSMGGGVESGLGFGGGGVFLNGCWGGATVDVCGATAWVSPGRATDGPSSQPSTQTGLVG